MAELLQSLKEVQAYLTSQKKVLKKAGSLAACMDQQATAWEAKLKTAKITASDAEDLLQVLAKGPWTESQAELIGTAINQAVLGNIAKGAKPGKRPPQTMTTFQSYLTKRDMDVLSSTPTPMAAKIEQLASRCVQLGLMWPNEPSIRHIVAVAIGAGLQAGDGTPAAIFEVMKEFKRVLRNMRSKVAKSEDIYLVEYPKAPQDLAKLMATYAEGDPPVPSFEPSEQLGLCQISAKISLRGNNKMLENGTPSSSQSSQAQSALGGLAALVPALQAAAAPGASENPLLALANVCQSLFQPPQPKEKHIPGLTFLKPKDRKSVTPQGTEESPRVACPEGPASSKLAPPAMPEALADAEETQI